MQKDDVSKKGIIRDSVVRNYRTVDFDYRLQPNDLLSIRFVSLTPEEYDFFSLGRTSGANVLNNAALLIGGDLIDDKGEIPFPVVGKVKVAGLTVYEAQEKLQAIAAEYLDNPVVKVRLLNYRFSILGEVKQQGTFNTLDNRISIIEAISMAGGLTDLADKRNVKIIRQKGNDVEVAYIDTLDEDLIFSPFYYVYQNDILVVSPLKQRPFRAYFGPNLGIIISALSLSLLVYNLITN